MRNQRSVYVIGLCALGFLLAPAVAHAYVGPGAGMLIVSSFLTLLTTFCVTLFYLLTWPIRITINLLRGWRALRRSRAKRVVVIGFDGQDPDLTEQYMNAGLLPNFSRLRERGSFQRLQTSLLSESPVAWSCFQTGCNPGKHRIFDFLQPNRKTYLPELTSAGVGKPRRTLRLGRYRIPLGRAVIRAGRKSVPFWKILGDRGVFSTIIRVPITFPPEKFRGVLLSAMCVPDLKGSQGTFSYYSTDPADENRVLSGGVRLSLERNGGVAQGYVAGPENSIREGGGELRAPFEVRLGGNGAGAELRIGKERYPLRPGEYTPYIPVVFRPGLGLKVGGLIRFLLLESAPHLRLYATPVQIDPRRPALPISHPLSYSMYLAKTQGPFSTLGLAEDTNALKSGVLDEEAFLLQARDVHDERERMLFDALDKTRRGAVVCVFDFTDRLQHMFFRYLDKSHPANRGRDTEKHEGAIRDAYQKMDELLGRVMARLDDDTVLMVMSDHGFKTFQRSVNLNTWLWRNDYLALKGEAPTGAEYFQDVDWSGTRAYAVGFGGIYLNLKGREAQGVVAPGAEADALKREIREKLRALRDEERGVDAVREVYDAREVYTGPYAGEAPDLIAGFRVGHRASTLSVTGGLSADIIEDNTDGWGGDHNFNPPDVPGMLFCNRPIEDAEPRIIDLGPTVLDLFGVAIPAHCDGRSLLPGK